MKLTYVYEVSGDQELLDLVKAELDQRFTKIADTSERVARSQYRQLVNERAKKKRNKTQKLTSQSCSLTS